MAKKRNKIKSQLSAKIAMGIASAIFFIYGVSLLFPLTWCLINSLKSRQEFLNSAWALPKYWYIENWIYCFGMSYNDVPLWGMFLNSGIYTFGCTAVSVFFSSVTAYILTKYKFPGSDAFYTLAFIIMMIPMVGNTAATYKLYNELGMYNTYWGPIVGSCGGFGMGFILLYGFFRNLSWTYAEAAFIDRANHFQIFFKIMLPMAMPAVIAIGIQSAVAIWNDYYTFYMYAPDRVTIALGLHGLVTQAQYGVVSYPQLFSAMIISIIPVIVVYACCQKFIIKNTTLGGIKG